MYGSGTMGSFTSQRFGTTTAGLKSQDGLGSGMAKYSMSKKYISDGHHKEGSAAGSQVGSDKGEVKLGSASTKSPHEDEDLQPTE